jgi:hypothetical protein
MSSKSRNRHHTQPAMSPLLRALSFSRAAHGPVLQAMLLQSYTALDAFRRGHGSRALFTTLGRQLLIALELCRLGHQPDDLADIESAHAAMMHMEAAAKQTDEWHLGDDDYAWLCIAFESFSRQLSTASLDVIAKAEARMVGGLLKVEPTALLAEAPV